MMSESTVETGVAVSVVSGEDFSIECQVNVDWITTIAVVGRTNLRKSSIILNLVRDNNNHILLVGDSHNASSKTTSSSSSKKRKFVFKLDQSAFKVFAQQSSVDKGQFTIAVELPGGTIAHVMVTDADSVRIAKMVAALNRIQKIPNVRPEDIGL